MGTQEASATLENGETLVTLENSQGIQTQATLLKLGRFQAAFESYAPVGALRLSEVIEHLRIRVQGRLLYSGRAVITNLIHLGSVVICETSLDEAGLDLTSAGLANNGKALQQSFKAFIAQSGKSFKVRPEFKVVIADMQTLFQDLRLWMEQMELSVRSEPSVERSERERALLETIQGPVLPTVAYILEKFEALANQVETDLQPAHRTYMRRQIHPVVMCSPFLYRTFQKPLGYAGDYEMVNMMLRDPFEGASMFAKLVNRIFLDTAPVLAHQSRIDYLKARLEAEAARSAARRAPFRVYNLGCGPAKEIQNFLTESHLSDAAEFTLIDFNEETLAFSSRVLEHLNAQHRRGARFKMIKKSVHQLLKEASRTVNGPTYPLVYCAGLLDYLPDAACRRLVELLYEQVTPGGLLIITNVGTSNPSRNWMEYVLDWHLLYRSAAQLTSLAPSRAPADAVSVQGIGDGVNIALEIRKPDDAN